MVYISFLTVLSFSPSKNALNGLGVPVQRLAVRNEEPVLRSIERARPA